MSACINTNRNPIHLGLNKSVLDQLKKISTILKHQVVKIIKTHEDKIRDIQ
jgi:hypothetical protein